MWVSSCLLLCLSFGCTPVSRWPSAGRYHTPKRPKLNQRFSRIPGRSLIHPQPKSVIPSAARNPSRFLSCCWFYAQLLPFTLLRMPLDQPLRQHHQHEDLRPLRENVPRYLTPLRFRIHPHVHPQPSQSRDKQKNAERVLPQDSSRTGLCALSFGNRRLSADPFFVQMLCREHHDHHARPIRDRIPEKRPPMRLRVRPPVQRNPQNQKTAVTTLKECRCQKPCLCLCVLVIELRTRPALQSRLPPRHSKGYPRVRMVNTVNSRCALVYSMVICRMSFALHRFPPVATPFHRLFPRVSASLSPSLCFHALTNCNVV